MSHNIYLMVSSKWQSIFFCSFGSHFILIYKYKEVINSPLFCNSFTQNTNLPRPKQYAMPDIDYMPKVTSLFCTDIVVYKWMFRWIFVAQPFAFVLCIFIIPIFRLMIIFYFPSVEELISFEWHPIKCQNIEWFDLYRTSGGYLLICKYYWSKYK